MKPQTGLMSTITTDRPICTVINVFTVAPGSQQALVDVLMEATERVMRHVPGFISANIHRSVDGVRVANYAQWVSQEAFEAMLARPDVAPHLARARQLATNDGHLYEVAFVDEA
jgi:quinol monooxygenase YgiN